MLQEYYFPVTVLNVLQRYRLITKIDPQIVKDKESKESRSTQPLANSGLSLSQNVKIQTTVLTNSSYWGGMHHCQRKPVCMLQAACCRHGKEEASINKQSVEDGKGEICRRTSFKGRKDTSATKEQESSTTRMPMDMTWGVYEIW